MQPKLKNATFSFTTEQLKWIEKQSQKTGLRKADIIRRAVDGYVEQEEAKERRNLFTAEQRQALRETAREKGVSEKEVIQSAVKRELNFMERLRRNRKKR